MHRFVPGFSTKLGRNWIERTNSEPFLKYMPGVIPAGYLDFDDRANALIKQSLPDIVPGTPT